MDLPCSRCSLWLHAGGTEPREHLRPLALSRPAVPPSPLSDRVGYSDHVRFRGYVPVHCCSGLQPPCLRFATAVTGRHARLGSRCQPDNVCDRDNRPPFHHAWISPDGVQAIDLTLRHPPSSILFVGIPFSIGLAKGTDRDRRDSATLRRLEASVAVAYARGERETFLTIRPQTEAINLGRSGPHASYRTPTGSQHARRDSRFSLLLGLRPEGMPPRAATLRVGKYHRRDQSSVAK